MTQHFDADAFRGRIHKLPDTITITSAYVFYHDDNPDGAWVSLSVTTDRGDFARSVSVPKADLADEVTLATAAVNLERAVKHEYNDRPTKAAKKKEPAHAPDVAKE